MAKEDWKPPAGYRKVGAIIREDLYQKILTICGRTGKKPWQVLNPLLEKALSDVKVPPDIDLEALLKTPSKRKKQ